MQSEESNMLVKLAKAVIEHAPEGSYAFWDIKFSDIEAALSAAEPIEQDENPMRFFAGNVDKWGALEWFNRMVDACEDHDRKRTQAFRCENLDEKDMLSLSADTSKMIMSSSAFQLARNHKDEIRSALSAQVQDESEVIDCLLAGKPFVFDPATNFCHADDCGAPEYGIKYVPAAQVQDVAESKPLELNVTKEWFEKRAALEGDLEIGAGRRKLTACIDPTPDELAELYRIAHRIPEGWQLVPTEPTKEMCEAAPSLPSIHAVDDLPLNKAGWSMKAIQNLKRYRAMLAAAPAKQEG